ncbi:MAG: glycosyltransferase family 39 protein [Dehalococcoidia bacterium]
MISARLSRIDPCILVLIFLTVFGFALRMYDLGSQSLWYDEGYSIQAALAMLDKGAPVLPSGWFYTHGLLNTSFIAASMGMFGETELAARLPSVIFGTLTIPLVFFFARRIGGTRTALIAAFIVTFLALEIAWSRQARMYQQLQFFYILSLYLFYLYTQKRSNKLLILTVVSTICAVLSHTSGASVVLVFLAWLLLANIRNIRRYANREFLKSKQTIAFILFAAITLIVAQAVFHVFSGAWGFKMNYFTEYTNYLAEFLPVILYMGAAGIIVMFKREWKTSLLLLLALAVPFYFFCFQVKLLSMRYLYLFMPVLIIYFAYTVTYVGNILARALKKRLKGSGGAEQLNRWLGPALCVVIIGLSLPGAGFNFLPQSEHWLDMTAPQPDFKLAYNFVNDNAREGDVIIDTWPSVGLFYLEREPDYWLDFDIAGTHGKYCIDGRDRYANISCIQDVIELEAVINASPSGWLVMDKLAAYRLPQETVRYIEQNLAYYEEGSRAMAAGTVLVYGWPNASAPAEVIDSE